MIEISKVDIAMSAIERELMNQIAKMGFGSHPLVQLGLKAGKQMWGAEFKAFVASVIESDATMDAGKEVAKESFGSFLDDFQAKLKTKLEDNNAQDTTEA